MYFIIPMLFCINLRKDMFMVQAWQRRSSRSHCGNAWFFFLSALEGQYVGGLVEP